MIIPVLIVIAAVAVLVFVVTAVVRHASTEDAKEEELASDRTNTVTYRVVPGQDPVYVVTALERAGFTAAEGQTEQGVVVTVECPAGVADGRERIREVLRNTTSTGFEGAPLQQTDVRFTDEDA